MTTLDDLRSGPTTRTVPDAGRILGLGRDAAYAAAERGEIPTLRFGRRLVVPTHQLIALLEGRPLNDNGAPPASDATVNGTSPQEAHSDTQSAPASRPTSNVHELKRTR